MTVVHLSMDVGIATGFSRMLDSTLVTKSMQFKYLFPRLNLRFVVKFNMPVCVCVCVCV